MARIVGIWTASARRVPMEGQERVLAVADHGLEGCAHARPGGSRQVLFASSEHLRAVGVAPGTIRENFTVDGADVQAWPAGQRVRVGEALFEVTMVCEPCERMDEIRPELQAELAGRRGMLARVVEGGEVAVGDPVELL